MTTARHAWSDTVSLSVRRPKPPVPECPSVRSLARQSLDCRNSSLEGCLVLAPQGSCSFTVLPGPGLDRIPANIRAGTGNVEFSKRQGPSSDEDGLLSTRIYSLAVPEFPTITL